MPFQPYANHVDSDLFAYLWFTGMSFQLHANHYLQNQQIDPGFTGMSLQLHANLVIHNNLILKKTSTPSWEYSLFSILIHLFSSIQFQCAQLSL